MIASIIAFVEIVPQLKDRGSKDSATEIKIWKKLNFRALLLPLASRCHDNNTRRLNTCQQQGVKNKSKDTGISSHPSYCDCSFTNILSLENYKQERMIRNEEAPIGYSSAVNKCCPWGGDTWEVLSPCSSEPYRSKILGAMGHLKFFKLFKNVVVVNIVARPQWSAVLDQVHGIVHFQKVDESSLPPKREMGRRNEAFLG
ncbi:hypothetical protein TNCV_2866791 [Trichonephila clavipes]|nr:hypothetical protein TNCV_2866791 [Trichonephila clavipes]